MFNAFTYEKRTKEFDQKKNNISKQKQLDKKLQLRRDDYAQKYQKRVKSFVNEVGFSNHRWPNDRGGSMTMTLLTVHSSSERSKMRGVSATQSLSTRVIAHSETEWRKTRCETQRLLSLKPLIRERNCMPLRTVLLPTVRQSSIHECTTLIVRARSG